MEKIELNDEQQKLLEDAKSDSKMLVKEYNKLKMQAKTEEVSSNNPWEKKVLWGMSGAMIVEIMIYIVTVFIILCLTYEGLNSYYSYLYSKVKDTAELVWKIKRGSFLHWFLSKDNPNLPLGILIQGANMIAFLSFSVEISFAVIRSKNIEFNHDAQMPAKQKLRLLRILICFFIMSLASTLISLFLGTRGYELYLEEQYFALASISSLFGASLRVPKSTQALFHQNETK